MSDEIQSSNITVQAIKPVGYFAGLMQSVGRILVSGMALILVFVMGAASVEMIYSRSGLEGLLTGGGQKDNQTSWVTIGGDEESQNRLLVLDLSGVILGTPPWPAQDSYFYAMQDVTFGNQLKEQIIEAAEDESIRGILLHTSTPGGTIFGSLAIHEGITHYREQTGKPVAVWIEGVSASGGVYATAAASAIYAAPGSATGSVGVIGGSQIYYNNPTAFQSGLFDSGVVTKDGIEVTYMHAGRGKDGGNPFRRMTDEERDIRQKGLDRSYAKFVDHLSKGRGIPVEEIVDDLGAHLYGNVQAARYGLIDATLGQEGAWQALSVLAGIEDYVVVRHSPPKQSLLEGMLAEDMAQSRFQTSLVTQVEQGKCQAATQAALVYHGSFNRFCVTWTP